MVFREYLTSSGKIVLLGKSADNNEELVIQSKKDEILLHTKKPGSPFVNIKCPKKKLTKKDIYESSIMCAKHSQDWRDNKKDVVVNIFSASDIFKMNDMKTGTFGVKKDKKIIVKKSDIINFEKELSLKTNGIKEGNG